MKNLVICLGIVFVLLMGVFVYMSTTVHAPVETDSAQGESLTTPEEVKDTEPTTPVVEEDVPNTDVLDIPSNPATEEDIVACTMDVRQCPDGSFVGRSAPDCAFAACPSSVAIFACTDEMRSAQTCTEIYQPVCGLVQVQCVTTPCPPVPKTFGNSCATCMQDNVLSYTNGQCTTSNGSYLHE